jgi:putative peptidoglycan lipid II flippase
MIGRIFTVGGFTLLSRITGFGATSCWRPSSGAGPIADAFFVALRLPNHFRGDLRGGRVQRRLRARLCAHPPAGRRGPLEAVRGSHVFTLLFVVQAVLLRDRADFHAGGHFGAGAGLRARQRALHTCCGAHAHHRFPICS